MKQIRQGFIVTAAFALAACVTGSGGQPPAQPGQPPAPPSRAWALTVASAKTGAPIKDAEVAVRWVGVEDAAQPCVAASPCATNGDGYLLYPSLTIGRTFSVHVAAAGFYSKSVTLTLEPGSQDAHVVLESAIVIPDTPRLHVTGKTFFTPDNSRRRLVLASELSPLRRGLPEWAANLKQWADIGFDGTRLFAGELGWADGQTEVSARAALPGFLEEARKQGLYTLVTAVTGSATGFDVEAHVRAVAAIAEPFDGTIFEVSNEWYHPTQSPQVQDPVGMCALAKRILGTSRLPWALGAAPGDEPDEAGFYAGDCGPFATAHLDRGRDLLNQVRRVREIRAIKDAIGKAVGNTEPLGAAEIAQPGRRFNEPWWFYLLSVLNAGFGVDVTVFHSEDGLNSRLLGPTQVACARAFVAGARLLPEQPYEYKNVGHAGGPVKSAKFVEDGGPIVRAYAFMESDQAAYVVVIHTPDTLANGDGVELVPGWHVVKALPSMAHASIYRVERDREHAPALINPLPKAA